MPPLSLQEPRDDVLRLPAGEPLGAYLHGLNTLPQQLLTLLRLPFLLGHDQVLVELLEPQRLEHAFRVVCLAVEVNVSGLFRVFI